MTEDKATLHELADEYGVSAERIRQIEAGAIARLKGLLPAPGLSWNAISTAPVLEPAFGRVIAGQRIAFRRPAIAGAGRRCRH